MREPVVTKVDGIEIFLGKEVLLIQLGSDSELEGLGSVPNLPRLDHGGFAGGPASH